MYSINATVGQYARSPFKRCSRRIRLPLTLGLMVLAGTGCFQFSVDPPQTHQDNGITPPKPPAQLGDYLVYYGDLHSHTALSDGTGLPEDAYVYARDKGHLDFFGLADHEWTMTDQSWAYTRKVADQFNEDGSFVTFCGFEWSSLYGHVTVTATDSFCYSSDDKVPTFSGLCSWLSTHDCIAFFNHPGQQGEFNYFASEPCDRIIGMELWNKNDGFSTCYYNDGFFQNDHQRGFYDEALIRGWKIGAAGGCDTHYATWGTMTDARIAVLAKNLTREDILEAFRARRFYSTMDKNLVLSFTVDDNEMGSTVTGSAHAVRILASGTDYEPFSRVMLFNSNHDTVQTWAEHADTLSDTITYSAASDDFIYVIVRQADGDEAISSPVWITPSAEE